MADKKGAPDIDARDLQAASKQLREFEADEKDKSNKVSDGGEAKNILHSLEELYEKYDGDMRKIFDSLGESPRKALKHPPKDKRDFALKYYDGAYQDVIAPASGK